jgi:hypothetical protein
MPIPALQTKTGTIVEVQRLLAAIVLSIIGFLPVAEPLSIVSAQAKVLPTCCRAHGQHKCAMPSDEQAFGSSPAGPSIHSVCGQYPFLPAVTFAAANSSVFPPKDSLFRQAFAVSRLLAALQSEIRFSGYFEGSHHKRGPPAFLS